MINQIDLDQITRSNVRGDYKKMKCITTEEYTRFEKHFTFAALKGLSFGQAFCNYFDIRDYYLLYTELRNPGINTELYIKRTYRGYGGNRSNTFMPFTPA